MTEGIIIAAIGTAGSIVGACIAARSAVDKKTREDDIKAACTNTTAGDVWILRI